MTTLFDNVLRTCFEYVGHWLFSSWNCFIRWELSSSTITKEMETPLDTRLKMNGSNKIECHSSSVWIESCKYFMINEKDEFLKTGINNIKDVFSPFNIRCLHKNDVVFFFKFYNLKKNWNANYRTTCCLMLRVEMSVKLIIK